MTLEPIRREAQVELDPEAAFRLFTSGIESWWPLESHSRLEPGQERTGLVFEEGVGGRLLELTTDGELAWGTVVAWDPGRRLVLDWKPNDDARPPTQVEVTFAPAEDGGSLVSLEHSGWERLGPDRGPEARASYGSAGGWDLVFEERFVEAAGAAV